MKETVPVIQYKSTRLAREEISLFAYLFTYLRNSNFLWSCALELSARMWQTDGRTHLHVQCESKKSPL